MLLQTAIFDLRLRYQRFNVIVRSLLCIIIEKKQNGGIFHSSKSSNYNAFPMPKFPSHAVVF